ncbi:hypothetical protein ACROYT_G036009 [Oculina patagonica]
MKRFMFTVVSLFIVCSLLRDEVMGSSLRNKRVASLPGTDDRCPPLLPGNCAAFECFAGVHDCSDGRVCCSNGCGYVCVQPLPDIPSGW